MSQTTGTGAKKIQGTDDWRDIFDIHNDTVDAYDGKIGTTSLPTTAQTLTGAIAEHEDDISTLNGKISNFEVGADIPYNSSHQNDIVWMLQNALNNNVFKNEVITIGLISPSAYGMYIARCYQSSGNWYGSILVDYIGNITSYEVSNNIVNKKNDLKNGNWETVTVDSQHTYTVPDNGVLYFYIGANDSNPGYAIYTISTWRTVRINVSNGFAETMYVNVCAGDEIAFYQSSNVGTPLIQFRKMY